MCLILAQASHSRRTPALSQGPLSERPLVLLDDAGHVLAADARAIGRRGDAGTDGTAGDRALPSRAASARRSLPDFRGTGGPGRTRWRAMQDAGSRLG